jgi:hypothetical protein
MVMSLSSRWGPGRTLGCGGVVAVIVKKAANVVYRENLEISYFKSA